MNKILEKLKWKYQGLFLPWYDGKYQMIHKSLQYTEHLEGDYLEFGVFKGATIIPAYLMAHYNNINTRFFAFDSFVGYPKGDERELKTHPAYKEGNSCCSRKDFEKILKSYGIKDINIVEGLYEEVLTEELRKKININKIKAVFIDVDLYRSTLPCLNFITPALQDGTVLMFKTWFMRNNKDYLGDQRAVKEWLKNNPQIKLTSFFPFYWCGLSFIVNIKTKQKK